MLVTTVLPTSWPALHRADGTILLALQTTSSSGDTSRDLAHALLEAIDSEPGTAVETIGLPEPGPRLQDVLDLSVPFVVTIEESFAYWLDPETERTAGPASPRSRRPTPASSTPASSRPPTPRTGAGWAPASSCAGRSRSRSRWSSTGSRACTARASPGFEGAKFVGYFRSSGLVVPVWELAKGSEAEDIEAPLAAFKDSFLAAIADTSPLDANARRARAGLVARQVTLR